MKQNKTPKNGFTLIEMAIVLLIMGLIVGAMFSFLSGQRIQSEQQTTMQRQQKIANALAYYAQMHNNLPCPSKVKPTTVTDPVGSQDSACLASATPTAAQRTGIVPFRVLGLSQAEVTDGYGNPFSYTVADKAHTLGTKAEFACRNPAWQAAPNAGKAIFCCQPVVDPQMHIFTDRTQTTNVTNLQSGTRSDQVPNSTSGSEANPAPTLTYFTYVLVSHGKNGLGAYSFCQTDPAVTPSCTNTRQGMADIGDAERKNADDDDNFVSAMKSTSSDQNDYFDDIVLWRTQDRIISEFNNDSCAKP